MSQHKWPTQVVCSRFSFIELEQKLLYVRKTIANSYKVFIRVIIILFVVDNVVHTQCFQIIFPESFEKSSTPYLQMSIQLKAIESKARHRTIFGSATVRFTVIAAPIGKKADRIRYAFGVIVLNQFASFLAKLLAATPNQQRTLQFGERNCYRHTTCSCVVVN